MKTIKTEMSDAIYDRVMAAGTKQYQPEVANPDYPEKEGSQPTVPNNETRDEYLAGVVTQAVRNIILTHEVQEASNSAVSDKQAEIKGLNITSTVI